MNDTDGEHPEAGPDVGAAPPTGLAVAALALAVFTVVAALAAWFAWLTVGFPSSGGWFAYAPVRRSSTFVLVPPSAAMAPWFTLAAAGTWFGTLPTAAVGLVLANAARRRATGPVRPAGVRPAVVVALGALLVAIAGIVALGFGAAHSYWTGG